METETAKEKEETTSSLAEEFGVEKVEAPARDLTKVIKGPRDISSVAIVGLFLLGTVAFLYLGRVFFLPLVLAMILSFLFRPVVKALAGLKIPEPLGAGIVLFVALFAIGNGVTRLTGPATEWIAKAPEGLRKVEDKVRHLVRGAAQLNRAAAQVEEITKAPGEERPTRVEIKGPNFADTLLTYTRSFLIGALETIVLLYFFLASGAVFLQKMIRILPTFNDKQQAVQIANELQHNISTFLFTVTIVNACLGVLVGVGASLVGMHNAILWGVVVALLNYVPYFGPIAGVTILSVAGLLTFDSVPRALLSPLIYIALHGLEANFITPMILGRRLTLNPGVIFLSLMFWTWLWGLPGALLSVPLLMMLKIFCDHLRPLAPVGEFLSG
jgi:predicted PurR-regulated permease PerM